MRVEVLGGLERRRRWSRDDKAWTVEETLSPGAKVIEVARRNGGLPGVHLASTSTDTRTERTIFYAGADHRHGSEGNSEAFACGSRSRTACGSCARWVDKIDLGNRRHIRVDAHVDPEALAQVLQVLERR